MITLHNGDLSFTAFDEGEGPLVLCLHGFPDTARSWRHQLKPLAAAGYRVVAPNLRGYEPGSVPADGDVFQIRMAEDVAAWIDELGADKAHIIGHDWGASVAFMATLNAPEKVQSLTMMSVPHPVQFQQVGLRSFKQVRNSWYIFFFQLAALSDRVVARNDYAFIERLWRKWSPGWDFPVEELRAVQKALAQPGVQKSALGYYRTLTNPKHPSAAQTAALMQKQISVPTLGIAGAIDGCIAADIFAACMRAEDFPAGLKTHIEPGAGHFVHQEKPDAINARLIEWLKENN
ncbi:MAG: alpha/beta fold hydrolase [Alphaproteobacteria bacterium]